MFFVFGLGNYDKNLLKTRHNAGFLCVDYINKKMNLLENRNSKIQADIFSNNTDLTTIKPHSYMNNCGDVVAKICKYYNIPKNKMIVIVDELDVPIGRFKEKLGGSANGHNGIRSIDERIGNGYLKIKIGIDRPVDKESISEYVLSKFSKDSILKLNECFEDLSDRIFTIMKNFDL